MKTICKTLDNEALFVVTELDPACHPGVCDLGFTATDDGFVRSFPNSPHIEHIYRNWQRFGEEMIMQRAGLHGVPWEQALLAFLSATTGQSIDWWLAGSAALAVRGVKIAPQDLDIITDGAGAQRLGELLLEYLVEPVVDCREGWISDWWGRAFLHARVEWVGDVHTDVDQPHAVDFGPAAASRLEMVNWHGNEIRVPPLDLQLQVSKRRGLDERVKEIERFLNMDV